MTKIKTLELIGFRGAKTGFCLDTKTRSVAVFGDNACGKSSITDAFEWFFTGRVGHLWREDCQAEALRNVNLKDTESSSVAIGFEDGPKATSKVLDAKLAARFQPESTELEDYLAQASSERLILRHQDLTRFVGMQKGEKRRYVANVIGYDDVTTFRDAIQKTLNALKTTGDYVAAKKNVDTHRAELLKHCGEIITTDAQYYEVLNSVLQPLEVSLEANTKDAVEGCKTKLTARIKQEDKAKRKLKLKALADKLGLLKAELGTLKTTRDAFLPKYHTLIENLAELKKLRLAEFLKKGRSVLDHAEDLDGKCPFCLNSTDLAILEKNVDERIEQLELTQANYQAVNLAKSRFVATLSEVSRLCKETHSETTGSPCDGTFVSELSRLSSAAKTHGDEVPTNCAAFKAIVEANALVESEKEIRTAIDAQKKLVEDAEAKEKLTHEEEQIVQVLQKITSITEHFEGHQKDTQIIKAFETQILTLQKIFDEFVKVQTSAMQNALDIMSEDIGRFYNAMHPNENAEGVHLSILGEEGVEFRYTFHGELVHPPMKYLSESHLNSLGIALFLASVKLFNVKSKFFVLDDIVSSFDIGHRRRLLRVLKNDFADWQIILLTHESLWFDIIRREMKSQGWLLHQVEWDDANGVLLEQTPGDFRALIEKKRKRNEDIENDLRKLLEQVLKEVCQSLEVKVAFRANEHNEKRMPGELMPALQGTLNKKCESLKGHAIFGKLDGSAFVANIGSHDNTEQLSTQDLEVVLQDIDELDGLFRCPECNVVAASERFIPHSKSVTCKCGKFSLPWKE